MRLSERAMLAVLHCGMWSGTATDHEVTDSTNERYGAERDAGRYTKQLVARKFLSHVGSVISAAKAEHRAMTLPWGGDGERILTNTMFFNYQERMHLRRLAVEAAAGEFVTTVLPTAVDEARERLGRMFKADEYPTATDLRKKFYLDVEIKPVPEAGDFRCELSEASVKAVTKDIEKRTEAKVKEAISDIYRRVLDVTGKMAETLKAYEPANGGRAKGTFRDSLVYNVLEVAELIPGLNITGDEKINELAAQLKAQLVEHSPEILRADAKARKKVSDQAEKLAKKAAQYM